MEPNQYNVYSVNTINAKKATARSVAIQFGGCDSETPNCLPIMKSWNYTVRLFLPRTRNPQWHMEIPRGAASELSPATQRSRQIRDPVTASSQ